MLCPALHGFQAILVLKGIDLGYMAAFVLVAFMLASNWVGLALRWVLNFSFTWSSEWYCPACIVNLGLWNWTSMFTVPVRTRLLRFHRSGWSIYAFVKECRGLCIGIVSCTREAMSWYFSPLETPCWSQASIGYERSFFFDPAVVLAPRPQAGTTSPSMFWNMDES